MKNLRQSRFRPRLKNVNLSPITVLLVDDDAATAERGGRLSVIRCARLVVVDDGVAAILVPYFDPELIHAATAGHLAVNRG